MAERTMLVTLRIQVKDLDQAELEKAAREGQCGIDDLPGIDEIEPREIADSIVSAISESEVAQEYIWAGSSLFAKFGDFDVDNAMWED